MAQKRRKTGGRYTARPAPVEAKCTELLQGPGVAVVVALDELGELAGLRADVEAKVVEAVADARSVGASWTSIGAKLGVSRQGAQERYGATSPPKGGTEVRVIVERLRSVTIGNKSAGDNGNDR